MRSPSTHNLKALGVSIAASLTICTIGCKIPGVISFTGNTFDELRRDDILGTAKFILDKVGSKNPLSCDSSTTLPLEK